MVLKVISYILIAVGSFSMLLGFLGCLGAIYEIRCLLGLVRQNAPIFSTVFTTSPKLVAFFCFVNHMFFSTCKLEVQKELLLSRVNLLCWAVSCHMTRIDWTEPAVAFLLHMCADCAVHMWDWHMWWACTLVCDIWIHCLFLSLQYFTCLLLILLAQVAVAVLIYFQRDLVSEWML